MWRDWPVALAVSLGWDALVSIAIALMPDSYAVPVLVVAILGGIAVGWYVPDYIAAKLGRR